MGVCHTPPPGLLSWKTRHAGLLRVARDHATGMAGRLPGLARPTCPAGPGSPGIIFGVIPGVLVHDKVSSTLVSVNLNGEYQ